MIFQRITGLVFMSLLIIRCSTSNQNASQNPEDGISIRIMTYNIHHANPPSRPDVIDVDAIAKVIQKENPDLVALQEVDVFTERSGKELHEARAITEKLGMNYYFAKALDYQGGYYGNAVLSRFPIQDSMRIELPALPDANAEDRIWAGVKVKVDGKDLWFGSTHLDFKTEENNLHQSRTLLSALKKITIPVIIGGDFNVAESSQTIAIFDQQFMRTCPDDCPPTIPVKDPTKTIDFLMYRPLDAFKISSHNVIDEQYASDHLPVVGELSIEN